MCYQYSIYSKPELFEKRFSATFSQSFSPQYHVTAFSQLKLPIITNNDPFHIQLFHWGLIPFWTKDIKQARTIQQKTANARAETIYEKPAFRQPATKNHCLILADGFYEWHEYHGKKYPFYIYLKSREPFAFAGIWDEWKDKQTQQTVFSFSVITTPANPLLEKIHNTKKRMPVILPPREEQVWISNSLSKQQAQQLLVPIDEHLLQSHTISRLLTSKTKKNNAEIIKPYSYDNLTIL